MRNQGGLWKSRIPHFSFLDSLPPSHLRHHLLRPIIQSLQIRQLHIRGSAEFGVMSAELRNHLDKPPERVHAERLHELIEESPQFRTPHSALRTTPHLKNRRISSHVTDRARGSTFGGAGSGPRLELNRSASRGSDGERRELRQRPWVRTRRCI